MSEIKQVRQLFQNIYDDLNVRIRTSDELYGCRLFKEAPSTTVFPHIQMHVLNTYKEFGTRDYQENKYPLAINVEIYTENLPGIKRIELANIIEDFVFTYFDEVLGMRLSFNREAPILDKRLHRVIMRFNGKYDIEQNKLFRE